MSRGFKIALLLIAVVFSGWTYAVYHDVRVFAVANAVEQGDITDKDVQGMYINIVKVSGQGNILPPLTIVPLSIVNAYTDGEGIFIYRGLINMAKNKDEVALVLAHEAAHFLLGHTKELGPRTKDRIRVQEMQADLYGAALMMKAGYDVCEGRILFVQFKNLFGDVMDQDHPDDAFRFSQLNFQCSVGDNL